MSDTVARLFNAPILFNAIAGGVVVAGVWWFYYSDTLIEEAGKAVIAAAGGVAKEIGQGLGKLQGIDTSKGSKLITPTNTGKWGYTFNGWG